MTGCPLTWVDPLLQPPSLYPIQKVRLFHTGQRNLRSEDSTNHRQTTVARTTLPSVVRPTSSKQQPPVRDAAGDDPEPRRFPSVGTSRRVTTGRPTGHPSQTKNTPRRRPKRSPRPRFPSTDLFSPVRRHLSVPRKTHTISRPGYPERVGWCPSGPGEEWWRDG